MGVAAFQRFEVDEGDDFGLGGGPAGLGEGDQAVGGVGVGGFLAALGVGGFERGLNKRARGGFEDGGLVGGHAVEAAAGAFGVGPAPPEPGAMDAGVAFVAVADGGGFDPVAA